MKLALGGRTVLAGASLGIAPGECVSVMGPSGSGKTSLLNCVVGITEVDSGSVVIDGTALQLLDARKRSAFRLKNIGILFQFGELLPELTAVDNVALPARIAGTSRSLAVENALHWLELCGVAELADAHSHTLSGGEQQRVALARAMAHRPSLLVADEPTGMLDEDNSRRVVDLVVNTAREQGTAVLLTTHDSGVAARTDRTLRLVGGALVASSDVAPVG